MIAQHLLSSARRAAFHGGRVTTVVHVTSAEIKQLDSSDAATRLRELLAQLENTDTAPRTDPRAQRQVQLCTEIEAILRVRAEARSKG